MIRKIFELLLAAAKAFIELLESRRDKIVSEERALPAFDRIINSSPADMIVQCGTGGPVTVTAGEKLLPKVQTTVKNGTLVVQLAANCLFSGRMEIDVPVGHLTSLVVNGTGDVTVRGLDQANLEVEVLSTGNVKLHGTVAELSLDIDGTGDIDAKNLTAGSAEIESKGPGDIDLTLGAIPPCATARVVAHATGLGSITLAGTSNYAKLHCRSNGDICASGLTVTHADIDVEGLGDVSLTIAGNDGDDAGWVNARVSGNGGLELSGRVRQAKLTTSGIGDIEAGELVANTAKLRSQGNGSIEITVRDQVEATVTGIGDITVLGEPAKRNTNHTGIGQVYFE